MDLGIHRSRDPMKMRLTTSKVTSDVLLKYVPALFTYFATVLDHVWLRINISG